MMSTNIHIPGIGTPHPSIDGLQIVASADKETLSKDPAISSIHAACHQFKCHALHKAPGYRSKLKMTLHSGFDLGLLSRLEKSVKGRLAVTQVELAFDIPAQSISDAKHKIRELVRCVRKRNHQRGYLDWVFSPDTTPPPGLLCLPTVYFEHGTSTVRLKIYARKEKLPQGQFSEQIIVRLEWTIVHKEAIVRHLGGNTIDDLINADLNQFLARNLLLQKIDNAELGRLLLPNEVNRYYNMSAGRSSQYSRAEIGARRLLRVLASRDPNFWNGVKIYEHWELAQVMYENPSHVTGYLKGTRDASKNAGPSDFKINKCFRPV